MGEPGTIRIVQNGTLVAGAFLDLTRVTRADGERGLLGLAFHPQFRDNGRLFVAYLLSA